MCGICRSHIETLHEGLKHPLFVWREFKLLDVNARHHYCSAAHKQTYLPLNGHGGYILKHNVLHLSVQKRKKRTYSDINNMDAEIQSKEHGKSFFALPVAS